MSAVRHPLSVRGRPHSRVDRRLGTPDGDVDVVAREVIKSFGPIQALRGVSLTIAALEFVTITGPSGSGKSTLLNLIGSLDQPDSGTITVGGTPVPESRAAVEFRRHVVGLSFRRTSCFPA